jgi:hypothetical protein
MELHLKTIPRQFDKKECQQTNSGTMYKHILIDAQLKTGIRGHKKTELTGRSSLRR